MKEFMFLFIGGDDVWDVKSPEEQQAHLQDWQEWIGTIAQQEKFIGGERLHQHGKTIHPGGSKITDRPLAEAKELIGGYLLVKATSLDEATDMAQRCPGLAWATRVEVREIWPTED